MREWLPAARARAGLTQAELAKKLDLTESYYSRIESGERQKKMDLDLAARMSVIFGIPVEEIIKLETTEAGGGSDG